ncbi:MAG: phosphatase PAP2 family protein [Caulobacteraceae bacterium]
MEIIKFIQSFSNPFFDYIFQLITMTAEDSFVMLFAAVIYWCISKEMGYKLGFLTISNAVTNVALKDIFKIPRPIGEEGIRSLRVQTAEGYSFPSGHTQNATTYWVFFMHQFRKRWIYALGVCAIFLVALSRLYLGVHTPLDVTGGVIIGLVWLVIMNFIYEASKKYSNKLILLVVIIPALIGLFVLKDNNYYKAVGGLLGLYLGYLIEPRYIDFNVKASLTGQIIKVSVGLAVAIIIRLPLKAVLPQIYISDFIRYIVIMVWITIAAPLSFKMFLKEE